MVCLRVYLGFKINPRYLRGCEEFRSCREDECFVGVEILPVVALKHIYYYFDNNYVVMIFCP